MRMLVTALIGLTFAAVSVPAQSALWSSKTIAKLQPDHLTDQCYFFSLDGVAEADPVRSGSPWFAVDRNNHPGAKELYATLLTARLTGTPVTVLTTGSMVCGYATISYVVLQ